MTMWPNHAEVEAAVQSIKLKIIHTRGVAKTYIKSVALIITNSLLFFEVVYFNGELSTGSM
jgi:hypothetical protein